MNPPNTEELIALAKQMIKSPRLNRCKLLHEHSTQQEMLCFNPNDLDAAIEEAFAQLLAEQQQGEAVAFKVHHRELCYRSDADDQSYGMWCPVSSDYIPPFRDGTMFYTAPPTEQSIRNKALEDAIPACKKVGLIGQASASDYDRGMLKGSMLCVEAIQSLISQDTKEQP